MADTDDFFEAGTGPAIMDVIAVDSLACSGCGVPNPAHLSLEHGLLVCGDACFEKCLAGNTVEFADTTPQMQVMHTNSAQTEAVILVSIRRPGFLRRKTPAEKARRREELQEQEHKRKLARQERKLAEERRKKEDEARRMQRAEKRTAEEEKRKHDAEAKAAAAERAKEKAAEEAERAKAMTPDAEIISVQALLKRDGIVLPQLTLAALDGVQTLLTLHSEAEAQLLEDALVSLEKIDVAMGDVKGAQAVAFWLSDIAKELFETIDLKLQKKLGRSELEDIRSTISEYVTSIVDSLEPSNAGLLTVADRAPMQPQFQTLNAAIRKSWLQVYNNYLTALWEMPRPAQPVEAELIKQLGTYLGKGDRVFKIALREHAKAYFEQLRTVLNAAMTSALGKPFEIAAPPPKSTFEVKFEGYMARFLKENEQLARNLTGKTRRFAAVLAGEGRADGKVDAAVDGAVDTIGPLHGGGGGGFRGGGGGFRGGGGGGFHRGGGYPGGRFPGGGRVYGGGGRPHYPGRHSFFNRGPRYGGWGSYGWGRRGWPGPRFIAPWLLPALYWSLYSTGPYGYYPMYARSQEEMESELYRLREENAHLRRADLELYPDLENNRYAWYRRTQ